MKSSTRPWMCVLGLVAGYQFIQPAEANTCSWATATPGPINYVANVANVYVPRDARIGSVIGTIDTFVIAPNPSGASISCTNDGSTTLRFSAIATAPPSHRINEPFGGADPRGNIFMTNIPGVGARIRLERPFDGVATNSFTPIGGLPIVPFEAENTHLPTAAIAFSNLRSYVTLVKTGAIPPGSHALNQQLFDGFFTGIGKGFSYGISGTVMQSQCTVGAKPVSVDPVPLGTWNTSDFTHIGYTTAPTAFTITLTNCESDPGDVNKAVAHIRLDGANGSLPVGDGSNGVFTLGTGSTAKGVGIQVLRADTGAPVPLGTDVPFGFIENGVDKVLEFKASFFQTHDSTQIGAGVAEGSLGFTLTYQ